MKQAHSQRDFIRGGGTFNKNVASINQLGGPGHC